MAVGCTHRVELKRSPFITPLPEGARPPTPSPAGTPAAVRDSGGPLATDSAGLKAMAEVQGDRGGAVVRPAERASGERASVDDEWARASGRPRTAGTHLTLARAYHHQRIFDLALEHYQAARELDPRDPAITRDMGRLWVDAGSPALGLTLLDEAIRVLPADGLASSYRGIALDLLSRHAEAEEALRRAVALDPRRWEFANNLGYNLLLQERYPEAAAELERGLELAPRETALLNNLGLAVGLAGDTERAFAAFRDAGKEAQAWNNVGVVHRARGEPADAARAFERAARLDPRSRAIAENLRESRSLAAEVHHRTSPITDRTPF